MDAERTITIELSRTTEYVWEGTIAEAAELTGSTVETIVASLDDGLDWEPEESGMLALCEDTDHVEIHGDDIIMDSLYE